MKKLLIPPTKLALINVMILASAVVITAPPIFLVNAYSLQLSRVSRHCTVGTFYNPFDAGRQYTPARSRTQLYLANSGTKKKKVKDKTICVNRLAFRNYEVIDTLEAGIALKGTEVKAIRDGKMNLRDGYIKPSKDGRSCILMNVHIGKHNMAGAYFQHDERRPRPLLVHRYEARRLLQQTEQQGMTVVPLKAYLNEQNKVKLQIALCRGKNVRDKRAAIKERDAKREANRIIKSFRV